MITFGGPDPASIRLLNSFPHGLFFHPRADNSDPKLHAFLIERYFSDGAALLGHESHDEINDVRNIVLGVFDHYTDEEVALIVQYFVQRVRNYAHIDSLAEASVEEAGIGWDGNNDCWHNAGRIIPVSSLKFLLDWMRRIGHQEYAEKVYGRDLGFPPFWFSCTCRLEGVIVRAE